MVDLHHTVKDNYQPVIDLSAQHIECKFTVLEVMSKSKDKMVPGEEDQDTKKIGKGQSGIVKIIPLKNMIVERYDDFPPFGRFTIRDDGKLIGVGVVKDVQLAI